MGNKIALKSFFIVTFFILLLFLYFKFTKPNPLNEVESRVIEESISSASVIEDVNYISKDTNGNQYTLYAAKGEIDQNDSNYIYLTSIKASIDLKDHDIIKINSDFGKYNINNFDTIFSKNVIIEYLNNNISGGYLDFSIERGSMIVSKNVVYNNLNNILKADVFNIDINTKDAKIFMLENNKKVNIKYKQ
jgi:hypothetical protein